MNPLSMSFSDFATISLSRRLITQGTLASYLRLHEYATPWLGTLKISAITSAHVQTCLAENRGPLAPKSLLNLLKYVRSVLRDAGSHVADALQVPVHEPNIRALDVDEAMRLRGWLSDQFISPVHAGLLVLLGTGLRRGELLNLVADDWRRSQGQLHVSRSKGRRVRDVDVPDWLVPVLDAHGGVFDVSKDSLRRTLNRVCDELGLVHIRVHDLRHTRITYLLLQGVPPLYVSQQAGHNSPAFTLSKYGHLIAASPAQRRGWCNA